VREHVAVIRIDYDASQATFSYVDSSNLEYLVENGYASVHHNYYNWINFLGSDLMTDLRGEVPVVRGSGDPCVVDPRSAMPSLLEMA
jgi:hypothetical protein